jgi:hypothetical protein
MRNEKSKRRKKKLAVRRQREKEYAAAQAQRAEFPEFVFDDRHADPEFAAVVRAAVEKFDFADLPSIEQTTYKVMRREGAAVAQAKLRVAMEQARAVQPSNTYAQLGDILWQLTTGELVFKQLSDADRLRFFPQNDFRIIPHRERIVVQCSSLQRGRTSQGGTAWYSRFRPSVEFGGREYTVAFTKEVLLKLQSRFLDNRMNYSGLGDVYGFLELCRHFEPCKVWGDREQRNERVDAITFFEDVSHERYWNHCYVKAILGAGYDPSNGNPYYRVGYCPVALDGQFAVAKTFLPPGFCKTPEYEAVCRANLPPAEKSRLQRMATDERTLLRLTEEEDFSAVRCYHASVPQVVQTHEEWYFQYSL